jgi:methyl-accepting chemotaxis protein
MKSLDNLTAEQAEYWTGSLSKYLHILRNLAYIMGDYEQIAPELRRDVFDDMLLSTLKSDPALFNMYTVWLPNSIDGMDAQNLDRVGSGPAGEYITTYIWETGEISKRPSGNDLAAATAWIKAPGEKQDRVLPPTIRDVMGKDMFLIRIMVPITNHRTNQVVGGVGCLFDVSTMQAVLEETISTHEEISAMAIYANNGFVLASYLPDQVGKMLPDVETIYGGRLEAVSQAIQDGRDFHTSHYSSELNTTIDMTLQSFPIGNSDETWTLMIGAEESYMLADVNALVRLVLIVALCAIVIGAVIIYLALGQVTKPIVTLADTLRDISEGEGDLTRTIALNSKDEVGDLAKYFNKTIEKIKNLVLNVKKEAGALAELGNDLAGNMAETAAAVNQITANVQSIQVRVINQSAGVTETNATMEQITENIGTLNTHVERQSASVSQSSSAIEEMLANIQSVTQTLIKNADNVHDLSAASEIGRNGLQEVAVDIQEISKESEGLLEINSVMENIASQTNLLSMNAAIEAAHAGDAGKGFAVVADEIRKLAEDSGEQSKTISNVLKKIKNAIDKITVSTDNVLARFEVIDSGVKTVSDQEGNIRNAMEEQGEGSQLILEAIGQVHDVTQLVQSSSMEMLEGSREVIRESKNLEKVTQEIADGMSEMAAGSNQINSAVHHANDLTGQNREHIDKLMREVAKFKVE